jgi:hypothetical protein
VSTALAGKADEDHIKAEFEPALQDGTKIERFDGGARWKMVASFRFRSRTKPSIDADRSVRPKLASSALGRRA